MLAAECPEENALVRFARGLLDEASSGPISAHLDGCASCRRAAAEAASDEPLAPPPLLERGARVGRYELDAVLGVGAMGAVFAAMDERLQRRVALKLLHASDDPSAQARLEREAQAMARLNHPHVVTVYELGDWTGGRFIAMELVEGATLEAWLPGRPGAERRRVLREAAAGLSAAHRAGVVHRDFKPKNLVIGADGRLRVTDFGLSRPLPTADLPAPASLHATQAGALVGTPAWMSPEQLEGKLADERSDQFAWCVTFVEALTGTRPFAGDSREALRAAMRGPPVLGLGLTPREREVLTRGLAEDPARRWPSLDALIAALDARSAARRWWMVGLAAVVVAVVAGFVALRSPAPAVPAGDLGLDVGKMLPLDYGCIERVAIGDPDLADVKMVGDGQVLLLGSGAGETTLLVWTCDGKRHSHTVVVSPAR